MNDVVDRILDMLGHEQVLPNHVTPNMDKAHHWHYRILPSYYDEEFDRRRSAGRNPTYDITQLFLIPPPSLGSSPGLPRGPFIVLHILHNLLFHCLLV